MTRVGANTRLDGNIFFTQVTDAIASPGTAPAYALVNLPALSAVTRYNNVGSYKTYGVAIAANGRVTRQLGWLVNYTWTHVRDTLPSDGPPFSIVLAPEETTPEHVVNIGLDYGGSRWFGAANARYTSATRQFAFDPLSQLRLLPIQRAIGIDAKLGYHFNPHLSAYAAGENLSDAGGVAGSPIPADRRLRIGVNYTL